MCQFTFVLFLLYSFNKFNFTCGFRLSDVFCLYDLTFTAFSSLMSLLDAPTLNV